MGLVTRVHRGARQLSCLCTGRRKRAAAQIEILIISYHLVLQDCLPGGIDALPGSGVLSAP